MTERMLTEMDGTWRDWLRVLAVILISLVFCVGWLLARVGVIVGLFVLAVLVIRWML